METKIKFDRKKQLEGIADAFESFLIEEDIEEIYGDTPEHLLHKLKGYCEQLRIIASEITTKEESNAAT